MGRRAYLRRTVGPCLLALAAAPARAAPASAADATLSTRLAKALAVPQRRSGAHGRARGRPPHRRCRLRAQRDALARPRLEREAAGHVRGARPARDPATASTPRSSAAGRWSATSGTATCAERLRRPDARARRPGRAGRGGRVLGDPARRRRRGRRRVVVRRAPHGSRLEAVLLPRRVAAALRSRRRPRALPRPHLAATRARSRLAARQALNAAGVSVAGKTRTGALTTAGLPLARDVSEPLADVVRFMGRESDNFTAEILLKQLGAVSPGTARPPRGARSSAGARGRRRAARRRAARRRLGPLAARPADRGSARRAAPAGLAAADLRDAFLQSLAVAGVNGTLEDRLERRPHAAACREDRDDATASALSGFVRDRYAFAVLQNGRADLDLLGAAGPGPLRDRARSVGLSPASAAVAAPAARPPGHRRSARP